MAPRRPSWGYAYPAISLASRPGSRPRSRTGPPAALSAPSSVRPACLLPGRLGPGGMASIPVGAERRRRIVSGEMDSTPDLLQVRSDSAHRPVFLPAATEDGLLFRDITRAFAAGTPRRLPVHPEVGRSQSDPVGVAGQSVRTTFSPGKPGPTKSTQCERDWTRDLYRTRNPRLSQGMARLGERIASEDRVWKDLGTGQIQFKQL